MEKTELFIDNLFLILTPRVLWIAFAFGLGILIMMSFALMYHWKEYALAHHVKNVIAQKIYFWVTMIMVLIAIGFLISYTIII